ncbi:MAG: TVP38/TMEM64 family protein [Oscillospiraceae bacterium]
MIKQQQTYGGRIGAYVRSCGVAKNLTKIIFQCISIAGLLACVVWSIYGYRSGLFTSPEALQDYIAGFGTAAALIFVLFQILQVIVPIFPGGISNLVGVLLFGPWLGFLYNYVGICVGSILAFWISRCFGRPIMDKLFSEKTIQKYKAWTEKKSHFAKLFTFAIILPGTPDDFLCYLAGVTNMSWKHFVTVILLGKPVSIAAYSLGLNTIIA